MIRGEIRRYHVVKSFFSTGNTGYAKRKEKVHVIYKEDFSDE